MSLLVLLTSACSAATASARDVSVLAFPQPARLIARGPSEAILGRRFSFPASAHDGAGSWYYVRLDLRLVTSGSGDRGPLVISASLNGLTSNRIEVRQRAGESCATVSEWNSVDLVRGFVRKRQCGGDLSLVSLNFVQRHAVHGGLARFVVQASGSLRPADSVTVLPGSGVYRTSRGPGRLTFLAFESDVSLQRGQWAKLPFTVRNLGGRSVRHVSVTAAPSAGLVFKTARVPLRGSVAPGSQRSGAFWVKARRDGRFKLFVSASSSANHPGVELTLFADGEGSGPYTALRNVSLAVALIGTVLLIYLFLRRRSARPADQVG